MELKITAADRSAEKLFYYCEEEEIKAAKIGHLRMDFGSGDEFYGSWFTTNSAINDQDFKGEVVIDNYMLPKVENCPDELIPYLGNASRAVRTCGAENLPTQKAPPQKRPERVLCG